MYDTIQFACGHSHARPKHLMNEEAASWLQKHGQCPDCLQTSLRFEIAEHAEQYNLPVLCGSDKQIEWAASIRFEKLAELEQRVFMADDLRQDEKSKKLVYTTAFIMRVTSSAMWIESRTRTPEQFLEKLQALFPIRKTAEA